MEILGKKISNGDHLVEKDVHCFDQFLVLNSIFLLPNVLLGTVPSKNSRGYYRRHQKGPRSAGCCTFCRENGQDPCRGEVTLGGISVHVSFK